MSIGTKIRFDKKPYIAQVLHERKPVRCDRFKRLHVSDPKYGGSGPDEDAAEDCAALLRIVGEADLEVAKPSGKWEDRKER